jgi:crotonobetainyl-CoA:carnitine CoA-transferase CaiB-like acyl-CoA transferase
VGGCFAGRLGAEVIKVESLGRPDLNRGIGRALIPRGPNKFHPEFPDGVIGEKFWDRNCHFVARNMGKLDITLDLAKPKGLKRRI